MGEASRLLKGMVAGNSGNYDGLGEWRYCHDCGESFFARASQPATGHEAHRWSPLPALDPEGQHRLTTLFQQFIVAAFPPERRAELERFARQHGWDMAREHQAGGGALTAAEVLRWREAIEEDLQRLVDRAERIIAEGTGD